jgi:hypothetical protein
MWPAAGFAYRKKSDFSHTIADYDPGHPKEANAYNKRRSVRVVIGTQLQQALSNCSEWLRIPLNHNETLDNRGFVYFQPRSQDRVTLRRKVS